MSYNQRKRSFVADRKNNKSKGNYGGNQRNRFNSKNRSHKKDTIHPSRFVREAKPVTQEQYEARHTFDDFKISEVIKSNLTRKGYKLPSPIQDQAIPEILDGHDLIGMASTGTGKTAAFAIPVINKLILLQNSKALIVAPTRELAQQIENECKQIGKGTGLFGALLIGGSSMPRQLRDLRDNPQIVIGTPGRIKDHLERQTLDLSNFDTVVLDEVDRMLDMGFINDMTQILSEMAPTRQSLFFSATMDRRVSSLINKFANTPIEISVKSSETSENVHQNVVQYKDYRHKIEQLHDILTGDNLDKVIIFDETQRSVERLSKELLGRGFKADAIHGGKNQGQRQRALMKFKQSDINILVATDVAARGIDVADISHVINYSTPQTYDDYVHRIGRAGRAGKIGHALTFIES